MITKPRIGVVTPSFNQGEFLEEAIDSVLSQNYPYLEYVVIDGGSTDHSVDIIRKYEKYLHFWISEKDDGQSNAINKGLKRLRGDVWAYLNSDDAYTPGTFVKVADVFQQQDVKWVTGRGIYVDIHGVPISEMTPVRDWDIGSVLGRLISDPIIVAPQVSNFMATSILDRFGYFDESLHYAMDFDFGLRPLLDGIRPVLINDILGKARLHPSSKTVSGGEEAFTKEKAIILERISKSIDARYKSSVTNALRNHRRHELLTAVRRNWEGHGRISGMIKWARAVREDPTFIYYRPALGLLHQIIRF